MISLLVGQGYEIILYIALTIMFGPPLLLWAVGYGYRKTNPKTKKIFYIIAVSYLILGLGICGSMIL